MKTIEDMAHEYAEALNDIADLLDMPTGSTSAQIVKMAGNRWASGMHTCHDQCSRTMCVLRRERDALLEKYATHHAEADRLTEVVAAAHAVVERWDTPLWKDVPATAKYINRLRAALSCENVRALAQPGETSTNENDV